MTNTTDDKLKGRRVMQKLVGGLEVHVYAIRNKSTGRFSNGARGSMHKSMWDGKPRVWNKLQAVRSHATGYIIGHYRDAEIVELEMFEVGTLPIKKQKGTR